MRILGVDYVSICVPEDRMTEAKEFYGGVLELPQEGIENDSWVEYQAGNLTIGLILPHSFHPTGPGRRAARCGSPWPSTMCLGRCGIFKRRVLSPSLDQWSSTRVSLRPCGTPWATSRGCISARTAQSAEGGPACRPRAARGSLGASMAKLRRR